MKAGKVWGETRNIWSSPFSKVDIIRLNAGGFCSEHQHRHMPNWFYVIDGLLEIEVWQESGLVDKTVLGPGEMTVVPARLFHCMRALEDTLAIEGYEPVAVSVADIDRRTTGAAK